MLIDDFTSKELVSQICTRWRAVSDQVMGGISQAVVVHEVIDGRPCMRVSGDVLLENNGGFIQAALDLHPENGTVDASEYTGVHIVVRGNGEEYGVHLRTPANVRSWQSYRSRFIAGTEWRTINLPFEDFAPHRLEAPLDTSELRRIGLVAIGRAFYADFAVSEIGFYREP
jgi:hypothetical protein